MEEGTYTDFKSGRPDLLDRHNYGFSGNGNLSLTQMLPWELRLSAGIGAVTRNVSFQGWSRGTTAYTVSLVRSFLKEDRLTVTDNAGMIFSNRLKTMNTVETSDFINRTMTYRDARSLTVSVSYRLGSLRANIKRTSKSIQNDDLISDGNPQVR